MSAQGRLPLLPFPEVITWQSPSDPPDDETTVLMQIAEDGVWQGYLCDGEWHGTDAVPVASDRVIAWAHVPEGIAFDGLSEAHTILLAAGDMLAALKRVVEDWRDEFDGEFEDGEMPALDMARAALFKATGDADRYGKIPLDVASARAPS